MQIIFDEQTQRYQAKDKLNNHYPQSHTMIGAIQNALSAVYYWSTIK